MDGIIAETKTLIDDFEDSAAMDAGLIGAAQAMEHYLLARYDALRLWAGRLGLTAAVAPIQATLAEVHRALDQWTALADALDPEDERPASSPLTLKDAALMGLR